METTDYLVALLFSCVLWGVVNVPDTAPKERPCVERPTEREARAQFDILGKFTTLKACGKIGER